MKMLLLVLFLFKIILFSKASANNLERCDEISISLRDEIAKCSFQVVLQVTPNYNSTNLLTISNFTYIPDSTNFGSLPIPTLSYSAFNICINANGFTGQYDPSFCFPSISMPYKILIDNGNLDIDVRWNSLTEHETLIFWGFVNDGNFIFSDGKAFAEKESCKTYNNLDYDLFFQFAWYANLQPTPPTICCTSFKQIPSGPVSSDGKCTNFELISKVYNVSNKDTVLTTSNANFILSSNDITAKGNYGLLFFNSSGDSGVVPFWYLINNIPFQYIIFSKTNAGYPAGFVDNIHYSYYPINSDDDTTLLIQIYPYLKNSNPYLSGGRIILRNNETLMSDGVPFTSTNKCQVFENIYFLPYDQYRNLTIVSEMCCSSFEGSPPTTTLPPPTPQIPPKNIAQKCDSLSIYFEDDIANVTISASLQTSTFNLTHNLLDVALLEYFVGGHFDFLRIQTTDNYAAPNVTNATFLQENEPLHVGVEFDELYYYAIIFDGIIDNGSFVVHDGQMFDSEELKCFSLYGLNSQSTICCENYEETSVPPQYEILPKCKKFRAVSTLYNITDESIYSSASAEFVLTDTDLIGVGNFSNNFAPVYIINGAQFQATINGTQFGGYQINGSNSEFLLELKYFETRGMTILVGRIITLDGQTLMEQGIPYTASNKCSFFSGLVSASYYTHPPVIKNEIRVDSELCCIEFDFSTTPTSPSPSTATTTSDGGSCHDGESNCQENIDKCGNSLYKPVMCKFCRKTCNLCYDPQCN